MIADALERIERNDINRLMVFMPPRHGKSELCSRCFPAWFLARNPTRHVIAASYNSDLAADFGRNVRNLFASEAHRTLFPDVELSQDSSAAMRWHTSHGGGYAAAGVGTAVTGRGAGLFLIDDPVKDRADADSEIIRLRTKSWYFSTAYTRLEGDVTPGGGGGVWGDLSANGDNHSYDPPQNLSNFGNVSPQNPTTTQHSYNLSPRQSNNIAPEGGNHPLSGLRDQFRNGTPASENGGLICWHGYPIDSTGHVAINCPDCARDGVRAAQHSFAASSEQSNKVAQAYRKKPFEGAIVIVQTRWHELDLSGVLLDEMTRGGDQWEVLSLPAIRTVHTDNGPVKKALWPERFNLERLEAIKRVQPAREWSALYQQEPTPDEGSLFKRADLLMDAKKRTDTPMRLYITADFAVTPVDEKGQMKEPDFTEIAVWGIDSLNHAHEIDWYTAQEEPGKWIERLIDFMQIYKPACFFGESGVIRRAIEPQLRARMRERNTFCPLEWLPRTKDKVASAAGLRGRIEMRMVHFRPSSGPVIEQLVAFPAGKHDDKVDACTLLGMALADVHPALDPDDDPFEVKEEFHGKNERTGY